MPARPSLVEAATRLFDDDAEHTIAELAEAIATVTEDVREITIRSVFYALHAAGTLAITAPPPEVMNGRENLRFRKAR